MEMTNPGSKGQNSTPIYPQVAPKIKLGIFNMFSTPIDAEKNSWNFGTHVEYGDVYVVRFMGKK